jgi:phosphate transport system substrate-binding protein
MQQAHKFFGLDRLILLFAGALALGLSAPRSIRDANAAVGAQTAPDVADLLPINSGAPPTEGRAAAPAVSAPAVPAASGPVTSVPVTSDAVTSDSVTSGPVTSDAVTSGPPSVVPAAHTASRDTILRFAGSNTMGEELTPALVKAFLQSQGASHIDRTTNGQDEVVVTADLRGQPVQVAIASHGSATGFQALVNNTADIANASRPISAKEEQQLQSLGVSPGSGSQYTIAADGIAIIVNQGNPVTTLTIDQLGGLYSGRLRWKDVKGPASCKDVAIYAQDHNSGTWDLFNQSVLAGGRTSLRLSPNAKRFEDSQMLSDQVAADPCSIGFLGLPYVGANRLLAIKATDRAYLPTHYRIRAELYPLSRDLLMYVPAHGTNPQVERFLRFVASPAAKPVIEATGFTSTDIKPPAPSEIPTLAPQYQKLFARIGPHVPLSTAIKFQLGTDLLDPKARGDLALIVDYFRQNHLPPEGLLVIGHADSTGTHDANCYFSLSRANVVSKELATLGLQTADDEGFCDDVPVATNDTDAGRQKNRRVEIWMPVLPDNRS